MNTIQKFRKLTISSSITQSVNKKPITKPKLIISGDWMKNAGFLIGEKVTISVSENLLIIQKV